MNRRIQGDMIMFRKMIRKWNINRMMMLVIALIPTCSLSNAAVLFNVDFESDTSGVIPVSMPAVYDAINIHPTSVGTTIPILVQENFTDSITGSSFGGGKQAVISDNSDATTSGIGFKVFYSSNVPMPVIDDVNSGQVVISADIIIDSNYPGTTSNVGFGLHDKSGVYISNVLINTVSGLVTMYEFDNSGSQTGSADAGVITIGVKFNIRFMLDYDALTAKLFINGIEKASLALPPSPLPYNQCWISPTGIARVAVDNVNIYPVPNNCSNAIKYGFGLAGDINKDCEVNLIDFAEFAGQWLTCIDGFCI